MYEEPFGIIFLDFIDSISSYIGYALGNMKFEYLESHHKHNVSRELALLEVGILNLMDALEEKFESSDSGELKIVERQKLFKLIKEYCYSEVMGYINLNPIPRIFDSDAADDFNNNIYYRLIEDIQNLSSEMEDPEVISDTLDFYDKVVIAFTFQEIEVKKIVGFRIKLANNWFKKGQESLAREIVEKALTNTKRVKIISEDYLYDVIYEEAKRLIEKSDQFGHKVREWICNLVGDEYLCMSYLGMCTYTYDPKNGDPQRGIAPYTLFEHLPEGWTCPNCGGPWDKFDKLDLYVCWDCPDCGYGYIADGGEPSLGIKPRTLFRDLPEDWTCPKCGAKKDRFKILS